MKLLLISERINQKDDDLAFHVLWAKEFIRQGWEVEAICLEKSTFDDSFPVHSLEKENGVGKVGRIVKFSHLILTLKYDRVLVLMNPEYVTLGSWWWLLRKKPVYLWYTHYAMHIHVRIASWVCKRMFAATPQSMPQFEGNPKKVVLGHGIDSAYWLDGFVEPGERKEKTLLAVHRLCRSKRLELVIRALTQLPPEYALDVYGRDIEKDYVAELRALVHELGLGDRVTFKGPVPMQALRAVYPQYRVMVNMASETIDKTMVEVMLFGVYPVTTPGNSRAIGLPVWPETETPEALAAFIHEGAWQQYSKGELRRIAEERHSVVHLMREMGAYIKQGD